MSYKVAGYNFFSYDYMEAKNQGCTHVLHAKRILVKTTPGIGGGGIKRPVEKVYSFIIYLIHCKKLCKCHNVPLPNTTVKEKRKSAGRLYSEERKSMKTHERRTG
jgi:hypothetical protein